MRVSAYYKRLTLSFYNFTKAVFKIFLEEACVMEFKLHSKYKPTGDQPQAIEQLNKPTLIISHNKTLAGQLYGEMKRFCD